MTSDPDTNWRARTDPRDRPRYSRRRLLRSGAAVAGVAATGGIAAAQETSTTETSTETRISTLGVIPQQDSLAGDVVGMWIHVSGPVEPIVGGIADACDIVDWGDQDTLVYDVTLFDRAAEPYRQAITLYLPQWVEVGPGDLFIVNDQVPCESGYVGVRLEQIGARDIDAGIKQGQGLTETPLETDTGGPIGGVGSGFGALAGLAGLLGGGWLLGRERGAETRE